MRCKNCGADNDDSRYICEICGSPLYDADEINNSPTEDLSYQNNPGRRNYPPQPEVQNSYANQPNPTGGNNNNNDAQKKSMIVIAVLAVILIAVIASVAVIAHNKNDNNADKTSSSQLTRADVNSDDEDDESSYYSKPDKTTEKTTKEKTTEKKTTEKKTTEKTTAAKMWYINTSSSGGGETEGDGEYKNGKRATIIARADDGYVFDGWYANGEKVSSSTKYTFKVTENASFSAVFSPAPTEPEKTTEKTTAAKTTESSSADTENTDSQDTTTDNDIDVMFGDDD